ncbi:SDR family NAD(P)-dependent oxidoreductase [Segeticoccus rhizosphaerae]|uniref:SDR family NAD(P)-dependent oxidoreductase n=1 Tax=Segeticoccus rhizosphaerae TaxID=1104777 RepID=UPI001263FC99|nr:SDR family oxidoreductase [Segeticoccus rhizosphaerae]
MTTALVTGASSGIGLAFCHELADRGHDLVIVARDRARLENLSDELRARHGVRVEVLPADLTDRDQVQRVADRTGDLERPVDLLVNNAGFGLGRGFIAGDIAGEERALDVMCRAVMVLSHAAAGAMRTRHRGAIINVSSVAGFVVLSTYSAVKSFVTVFSEALSGELAGSGVTVTALCPGFTRTEFHDRATMDMSRLPDPLWLDSGRLVRDGLADAARGKVVSVPGPAYKAVVALARVAPRRLVRRVSHAIGSGRRRQG